MSGAALAGWTPFRVARLRGGMIVDWCRFGALRPVDPFFHETLARAFALPFNLAFQRRTSIDVLGGLPRGPRPAGFVFHMSRCGSTLCAQALARDPAHLVLAEAAPIGAVLRAPRFGPASAEEAVAWLAGIVNALGQPRFGERAVFVKFTAADILHLPLIRHVFPEVPWIFVYRDPGEILASHAVLTGPEMIPGAIEPDRLGLTLAEAAALPFEVYGARCLAAFAAAALDAAPASRCLVLRHQDLVDDDQAWSRVCRLFDVPDGSPAATLRPFRGRHAKRPERPYADDRDAKRAVAQPWQETVDAIAGPLLARLDALRPA